MPLEIRESSVDDAAALARLDDRLVRAGAGGRVYPPEPPTRATADGPVERQFVAVDGEEVRGAVYLRQTWLLAGDHRVAVGFVKYPVAESLVDRRFAGVPLAMLRYLQQLQPNLLVMGMGGLDGPFAQFLARLRWVGHTIPTFVLPLHPLRTFAVLPQLAHQRALRGVARALNAIGVGALVAAVTRLASLPVTAIALSRAEVLPLIEGGQYDRILSQARHDYPILADRGAEGATWMFPAKALGGSRMSVRTSDHHVGYLHLQYVDLRGRAESPFGALRLAVVHDMLAPAVASRAVLAAGVREARRLGADLVLLNHSHHAWQAAARSLGFIRTPPNFACMRSPGMDATMRQIGVNPESLYVTRADDGFLQLA